MVCEIQKYHLWSDGQNMLLRFFEIRRRPKTNYTFLMGPIEMSKTFNDSL